MTQQPEPSPRSPGEDPGSANPARLPDHLVLYDGSCGLCNRVIQNLLVRDRERILRYAPLQGSTAALLRKRFPGRIPAGLETVVYVDSTGPTTEIWTRSEAAARLLDRLGEGGPVRALLRVIPRPLADLAYRGIATSRYRIFGRVDECTLPGPDDPALFLD